MSDLATDYAELWDAAKDALAALDWEGGNEAVSHRLARAMKLPKDYRWETFGVLAGVVPQRSWCLSLLPQVHDPNVGWHRALSCWDDDGNGWYGFCPTCERMSDQGAFAETSADVIKRDRDQPSVRKGDGDG